MSLLFKRGGTWAQVATTPSGLERYPAALRPVYAALMHPASIKPASSEPSRNALAQAYERCAAVTRAASTSFALAARLLPEPKRRAVYALYAFCRLSDEVVDGLPLTPARAHAALELLAATPTIPFDHPVLLAWHDTMARFRIAPELVTELLAGMAMDLEQTHYATVAELERYCYRAATVVGLMAIGIIGYDEAALPYAAKLGTALQLTNILRDVGEDARRGRVYIPQDDLERFGLTAADLLAGRDDVRLRMLIADLTRRAHRLYDEARPGIAYLHADGRWAIAAAAAVYREILVHIAHNRYDVLSRRAVVPYTDKLMAAWHARPGAVQA